MIEIIKVETKAQRKEFVEFQYSLYRDSKQFVPPFKNDIYAMMNEKKHPFYDHSISEFFLAKRDGKVVGKLSMLINRPFNEYHGTKDSEFYLFDCIDDQGVANALFDLATRWTLEHGMNRIVGPKGYGPLDGYGIQVEGFEHRQMMNMMNYNYPYYQRLVESYGFVKEVDFVSSYVKLDEFVLPEKIKKAIEIAKKRGSLTVKSFKNKKEIYAWKDKLRDAYNKSFVKNWEYYPLSDRELKFVIDNAIGFVIPKIVKFILDKDGEAVGFVLPFPDVSATMQKNKGKLGPIEIVRLMRALNQTEWLDFNGIGILPEYQGMGGNALLMEALGAAAREHPRFVHAELTQVAETATQMRKDLANLGVRFYKNHRVYKKELS
jgi:GNAT superfamily N-acetyltransferase